MDIDVEQGTITIPLEEYQSLKQDEAFIQVLEHHGIDNWEGFEEALSDFQEGPNQR